MTIFFVIGIGLIILVTINLGVTLLSCIFGDTHVSFMEWSYTKNPKSLYDKGLNIIFYAFFGIPHFFYVFFMKKYSYWKARFFYLLWTIFFVPTGFTLIIFIGMFLEHLRP